MSAPSAVARDLVDLDALAAWMSAKGLPSGELCEVERLGGGSQNVLVRFRRGQERYVLRRGPRHLRRDSNDVMAREIRMLRALDATDVPHPRVVASCLDEKVLGGAVFYLTEVIEGFNAAHVVPPRQAGDPAARRAMGFAAVDALARLAAVDHQSVGLGGMGRLDGFLERQVPRWLAHLEGYAQLPGYTADALPGVEDVADWLERNRPSGFEPGIVHGDYHLANLLFRHDRDEVAAVVDWEMCTVGDPLLDLGLLLASWPDDTGAGPLSGRLGQAGGLPSPAELLAHYATRSTRDLSVADWYVVLACFKTGIVVEGTHARAQAGLAPRATGDTLHQIALDLLFRAHRLVKGS